MRLNWPEFLTVAANETGGAFSLSPAVRSLLLSLLTTTDEIFQSNDMEASERDTSDALIALSQWELMHEFTANGGGSMIPIGAFIPFAGVTPPSNFLFCEGQVLLASEYPELYDAIHPNYKSMIEGLEFITLPDMRERTVAGSSVSYPAGWQHGEGMHTLIPEELPKHTHGFRVGTSAPSSGSKVYANGYAVEVTPRAMLQETETSPQLETLAHNNWQPTHHAPFIMCVKPDEE